MFNQYINIFYLYFHFFIRFVKSFIADCILIFFSESLDFVKKLLQFVTETFFFLILLAEYCIGNNWCKIVEEWYKTL